MKTLVVGGGGFIGSHTVDALVRAGHEVRVLDAFLPPVHPAGEEPNMRPEVELVIGDVRDKRAWEQALADVGIVYQFAAYQDYMPDFSRFFDVNSVGTALLYEVAVEHNLALAKVIIASSQAVYGEGPHVCRNDRCEQAGSVYWPNLRSRGQLDRHAWDHRCPGCHLRLTATPADERAVRPQNPYGLSKHHQERIALGLGRRYDIPTVALRYSIVQGPRQSFYNTYSGAARIFCLSAYHEQPCTIYEDGLQLRDYVNIDDVVAANLLVLAHDRADWQVFNVGGGAAYTVTELAEMVEACTGSQLRRRLPGEYRFGDTRHIVSDIAKLRALGWAAKRSPHWSIRAYLSWLKDLDHVPNLLDAGRQAMLSAGVVRKGYSASR